MTTILLQRRGAPGNETLKKRKEPTAFYNRFQPSAGPSNDVFSTQKGDFPLAEWNEISGKCFSHTPLGPEDGFV